MALGPQDPVRVDHPDGSFQLVTPPGYERIDPAGKQTYAFRQAVDRQKGGAKVLSLEVLDGLLGRSIPENLRKTAAGMRSSLPDGAQIRTLKERWRGLEIDVFEARYALQGVEVVTYSVDLPLVPRALQIILAAPAAEDAGLRLDLRSVLSTVRGKTNWLTESQRWMALGSGIPTLLAWVLVAVYAFGHVIFFRNRPLRLWRTRLAWLSSAVVLFLIGMVMTITYSSSKGEADMGYSRLVPAAVLLIVVDRVRKEGLQARAAPAV